MSRKHFLLPLIGVVSFLAGSLMPIVAKHNARAGVRGRNSDNTLLRQVLGWEPEISLEQGLARTYSWIEQA